MVYRVGGATRVLRKLLLVLYLTPRSEFPFDPSLKRRLVGDAAGQLHACEKNSLIIALWVGKVTEVNSGRIFGIGRAQSYYALAFRLWNVGRHGKSVTCCWIAKRSSVPIKRHQSEMEHNIRSR